MYIINVKTQVPFFKASSAVLEKLKVIEQIATLGHQEPQTLGGEDIKNLKKLLSKWEVIREIGVQRVALGLPSDDSDREQLGQQDIGQLSNIQKDLKELTELRLKAQKLYPDQPGLPDEVATKCHGVDPQPGQANIATACTMEKLKKLIVEALVKDIESDLQSGGFRTRGLKEQVGSVSNFGSAAVETADQTKTETKDGIFWRVSQNGFTDF